MLGTLLFNMSTADVSKIVKYYWHKIHQYADDCQVYLSIPCRRSGSCRSVFELCCRRVKVAQRQSLVIWLGGRQQVTSVDVDSVSVLSSTVTTMDSARNLGIVLDSQLTMSVHVSSICRSATPNYPLAVGRCCQDDGPGIRVIMAELLQLHASGSESLMA